jgi:hypothetical protein
MVCIYLWCVSTYGLKCYNNNWIKDILNKELVKTAFELYNNKSNIKFIHIKAHTNNIDIHSIGNYNADKLAEESIELSNKKIYIDIPYSKKDEIKKLGCLWDTNLKKWYYYSDTKYKNDILAISSK